jgi:hypothetical protein
MFHTKLRALTGAERRLLDTVLIHKTPRRVSPRVTLPLAVADFYVPRPTEWQRIGN